VDFQATMSDMLDRAADPNKVAEAAVEFQATISDILDQVAAEAAAGIGRKPESESAPGSGA